MTKEVIFGHSPDSDDAFMYYGIASGNIKLDNYKISHLMEDIESLNIRSEKGELDVTAISVAHYPKIMDKYQIMNCGSSVGRNYGPILVSKNYDSIDQLKGKSKKPHQQTQKTVLKPKLIIRQSSLKKSGEL